MVLLVVVIVSLLLAYKGLSTGLLSVLGRCAMGALSVAVAVGFAGPLRTVIPWTSPHLYAACLLSLAIVAYVLQRMLVSYYMLENEVALPEWVDRLGGAAVAFLGGIMLTGFAGLVLLAGPLPGALAELEPHIRLSAQYGLAPAKAIATFAGADGPLYLNKVLPQPDPPPPAAADPFSQPAEAKPQTRPANRASHRTDTIDSLFDDTRSSE